MQPAAAYNARKVHSPLTHLVGRHAGLALAAVMMNMKYAHVVQLQMWFAGNADSALLDLRWTSPVKERKALFAKSVILLILAENAKTEDFKGHQVLNSVGMFR